MTRKEIETTIKVLEEFRRITDQSRRTTKINALRVRCADLMRTTLTIQEWLENCKQEGAYQGSYYSDDIVDLK